MSELRRIGLTVDECERLAVIWNDDSEESLDEAIALTDKTCSPKQSFHAVACREIADLRRSVAALTQQLAEQQETILWLAKQADALEPFEANDEHEARHMKIIAAARAALAGGGTEGAT